MKKPLKIVGIVLAVVLGLGVLGFSYVQLTYERDFSYVPLPDIQASDDSAIIAQGEYLVHAVAHCSACHGPADSVEHHALGPRTQLQGGAALQAGPFGTFYPSNITSDHETGIGAVSDGVVARAVRNSVDRDGHLAAFMRVAVGPMSDEDLTAVVSYLRTLPPIENEVPDDEWGLLAKVLTGKFEPRADPPPAHVPAGGISVERGRYLVLGPAVCAACHTELDPMAGFAPANEPLSGAITPEPDVTDPDYEFVAPNLSPDPSTGVLHGWTEDQFVTRFRAGRVYAGSSMPWENFGQMTEEDLRSIFRYLQSLPPVENPAGPSRRERGWAPEG